MKLGWKRQVSTRVVLAICMILAVPYPSMAGESGASGWYVGGGAGANWISDMKQAGWNKEPTCYPVNECGEQGVPGYSWFYDLDTNTGSLLEIAVGRNFGNLRLELSANLRENDIDQELERITYLDSSPILPKAMSNYSVEARATMDDLDTRSLLLNAYYDFPLEHSRLTPYLGVGVGLSYTKLSGLLFEARYTCSSGCDNNSAEHYNVLQEEELTDTVFSKHLYAGADYSLDDRFLLGLKLSYSMVDDMRDTGRYIDHPVPDLLNHTKIRNMDHWSFSLGMKYFWQK